MSAFSSSIGLYGFLFLLLFLGLTAIFFFLHNERLIKDLRQIPVFRHLKRAIGLSVEAGQRIHINLGNGGIQYLSGGSGFLGLHIIQRVAHSASLSDRPPIVSTGDASLSILSQDVHYTSYREMNADHPFDSTSCRLTGLTSFSYASGAMPIISDEQVSVNILIGSFGSELALLTDAADRKEELTIGGSENLAAQSVLAASLRDPLIGEELFAAGAYLKSSRIHTATLLAQDFLRWALIIFLLAGTAFKIIGGM